MGRRNVSALNVDTMDMYNGMVSRAKDNAFAHLDEVPEEYRDMVAGILDEFANAATAVVTAANSEIQTLRQQTQNYLEQIASLERYRFGPRKQTVVTMDGQMTIEGMFDQNVVAAPESEKTVKVVPYVRRTKISNEDRLSHLPVREEYEVVLTEEQKNGIVVVDGTMMQFAGYQFVREEVKRVEIPTYRSRIMTPVFIEISDEQKSVVESMLAGDGLTYSCSLYDMMNSVDAENGETAGASETVESFEIAGTFKDTETFESTESKVTENTEYSVPDIACAVQLNCEQPETTSAPLSDNTGVQMETLYLRLVRDTPTPRAGFSRLWDIDDIIPRENRLGPGVVQVPTDYNGPRKVYVVPAPMPLIQGSEVSPSLMAHIIALKYSDAIPTYRMEKIFRREG